jgi:hypothetical protein
MKVVMRVCRRERQIDREKVERVQPNMGFESAYKDRQRGEM